MTASDSSSGAPAAGASANGPEHDAAAAGRRSRPKTRVLPGARRRSRLGRLSGYATLALLVAGVVLPPAYVTESAGPTFNTIGSYNGEELITVRGQQTYPTTGALEMTTVYVSGGPNGDTSALSVLGSWLDPQRTALPADLLYDPQITNEQVSQQNAADMADSQTVAQAAAARHLGLPVEETLTVQGLTEDSPAAQLESGDVLETIDGQEITSFDRLGELIHASEGREIAVGYRDAAGQPQEAKVTPRQDANGRYLLGVYLKQDYELPFSVDYGLDQVGGPSAGMMFALGITDELTEEDLTGGKHFAGTGTVSSSGEVGGIGGIRQKMVGARDAGADYFLAPAANCDEVVGHIPEGLSVVRVATLDDAVDAVREIGSGQKRADELPQCS